jgi:hypothetical protein
MPLTPPAVPNRLLDRERAGLVAIGLMIAAFGWVVETRSALQDSRKTDFGVYARTAWAVRAGGDIYSVADDNNWHYCYPPPFAVLMTPLADPPAGADRTGYLPFWASVAIWYVFGLGCSAFALDRFASAVLPGEPRWSRRWWYARTLPLYICVGGVGYTMSRGQVNLLVIAMLAGMFAWLAENRRFRAGLWLGAAVCLKVIPGFLGLFLLLRRDGRAAFGATAAVAIGLFVIPSAVWGPRDAVDLNLRMLNGVIAPGAGADGDQTRADELTNDVATDSQSFRAAIHNWRYPDRATRPAASSRETGLAHWAISGGLTLATVVVAMRRSPRGGFRSMTAADQLVLFGGLVALMLVVTPVSHMHYYAYGLPLVCGLWLKGMAQLPARVCPDRRTVIVLVGWGAATALPLFPWEWAEDLRLFGFGTAATVGLWAFAMAGLGREAKVQVMAEPQLRRAA